jgi:hypothetical protein
MLSKVKRYVQDPYYALGYDMIKKSPHLMTDKFYLSVLWKMVMGYKLDWKHPKTFNEKLQWLKLYDRNPLYTTLVDKYRVKQWVADKIGEQYVIPTLAVYNSVDEIDLDQLPNQFVLKCNHDSGSVVICRDKSSFDFEAAKQKLGEALKKNFYWEAREWPYKNVKRCIFAEKFLEEVIDSKMIMKTPNDYKFFCFNGTPKMFQTCEDRNETEGAILKFFDINGNLLEIKDKYHNRESDGKLFLPSNLEEMLTICRIIAENKFFVRVDFYEIMGKTYCGEVTFYENGGFCEFTPEKYNRVLGDWIKLPTDK